MHTRTFGGPHRPWYDHMSPPLEGQGKLESASLGAVSRNSWLDPCRATVPVQERLTVRLVSFPLQCLCFLNGPRWANTETRATGAKHISGAVRSQQEKKKATTFSEILTSWKLIFKNPLFLIIVNTIRKPTVNCYLLRHLYEGWSILLQQIYLVVAGAGGKRVGSSS